MDFTELNEAGLFAIDRKEFSLAITHFRGAMSSLNQERSKTVRPNEPPRYRFYQVLPIPLELDDEEPFSESTASQDGQFLFYGTSFLIDYEDVWYAYPFAVTTILYNMGLALHLGGLENPSRHKLRQAMQIYGKVSHTFKHASDAISTPKYYPNRLTRTYNLKWIYFPTGYGLLLERQTQRSHAFNSRR